MHNTCRRVSCLSTHVSWAQAYKAHVGDVSPRCGIEQNREAQPKWTISANWGLRQETLPHSCVVVVHVSWAQAYKAHVRGVSPQCGIKQNHEVQPKQTILANWELRQETLPHLCVVVIHVSWAQAYKAHVRVVSPQYEIKQNCEAQPKRTIPANWG